MIIKRLFSTSKLIVSSKNTLPTVPVLPSNLKIKKSTISQYFVDEKVTCLRAGKGGDGLVSFMHLKGNEFAGPDGGDGGNGGHILFKAEPGLKSLNKIQSIYNAESGEPGRGFHMRGKNGQHLVIKVPVGTLIKDINHELVHEIKDKNSMFVGARGGAGGKGNHYYLSNDNRRPKQFEPGHQGQEIVYNLQLKLIADAALIGYPNVGKSSLLNALTRARAKIGDYSFTTLHPHVGIVEYEDYLQISLADLPGLLPDLTQGFGTKFLHHLERCKIIIIVVDMSSNNPIQQYEDMKNALNFYNPNLLIEKPILIIGQKIDKLSETERTDKLNDLNIKLNLPIIPMSAEKKINLKKFLIILRNIYEKMNNEINKK